MYNFLAFSLFFFKCYFFSWPHFINSLSNAFPSGITQDIEHFFGLSRALTFHSLDNCKQGFCKEQWTGLGSQLWVTDLPAEAHLLPGLWPMSQAPCPLLCWVLGSAKLGAFCSFAPGSTLHQPWAKCWGGLDEHKAGRMGPLRRIGFNGLKKDINQNCLEMPAQLQLEFLLPRREVPCSLTDKNKAWYSQRIWGQGFLDKKFLWLQSLWKH